MPGESTLTEVLRLMEHLEGAMGEAISAEEDDNGVVWLYDQWGKAVSFMSRDTWDQLVTHMRVPDAG